MLHPVGIAADVVARVWAWTAGCGRLLGPVTRHRECRTLPDGRMRRRAFRSRESLLVAVLGLLALGTPVAADASPAESAGPAAESSGRHAAEAHQARRETEFLIDLFALAEPSGGELSVAELLDEGARRTLRASDDRPAAQARLQITLGRAFASLGRSERAAELFREALSTLEEVEGPESPAVADAAGHFARASIASGEYELAEGLLEQALDVLDRRADEPVDLERARLLADRGLLGKIVGRLAESEDLLRRSLALGESLGDPATIARALERLGATLVERGRIAAAEPVLERAVEVRREFQGDGHPDLATALNDLALQKAHRGLLAEARELLDRALDIRRRVLGPGHPDVGQILMNSALVQEDAAASLPRIREALEIWERSLGPEHVRVGIASYNLAEIAMEEGLPEDAEAGFRRAASVFATALGPGHRNLASAHAGLAELQEARGKWDEAEESYRRAVEIERRLFEREPADPGHANSLAWDLLRLGRLLDRTGRGRELIEEARGTLLPFREEMGENLNLTDTWVCILLALDLVREAEPDVARLVDAGWHLQPDHEIFVELATGAGLLPSPGS